MPTILIVGAADTGRAPMTAALLRRLLDQRGRDDLIESAGILGHDGDPATSEAIQTMEQIGIDIEDHVARSLSDQLAEKAVLLIAIDSGVARVARARFPDVADRIVTLGHLAGRQRDIPDPFKMQLGAWLAYAREIETLLREAMPRILAALGVVATPQAEAAAPPPASPLPSESANAVTAAPSTEAVLAAASLPAARAAAIERMSQLLLLTERMPMVVDWPAARTQIDQDLNECLQPLSPGDLGPALAGAIRSALSNRAATPLPEESVALREAVELLRSPVSAAALSGFLTKL
ncbi:MAG: low molecular weight phosphotyrosine protein phosphatase [Roseiflexaceae bacterium]